jgi:hypothetical protein
MAKAPRGDGDVLGESRFQVTDCASAAGMRMGDATANPNTAASRQGIMRLPLNMGSNSSLENEILEETQI